MWQHLPPVECACSVLQCDRSCSSSRHVFPVLVLAVSPQAVLRVVCQGAQSVGVPGFVSKTYLSFYAVLLCEVMAALPRVTEDVLTLLLPFLAAGLKGDASKEYTSATLMVLTQLLTRAQLSQDFLKGEQQFHTSLGLLWEGFFAFVMSGVDYVWLGLGLECQELPCCAKLLRAVACCARAVPCCVLMPVTRMKVMIGSSRAAVDASVCIP